MGETSYERRQRFAHEQALARAGHPLSVGEGIAIAAVWLGGLSLQGFVLWLIATSGSTSDPTRVEVSSSAAFVLLLLLIAPTAVSYWMCRHIVRRGGED